MRSTFRTLSLLLGLTASTILLGGKPSSGADWPQWRGPNREGTSSEGGWQTTWPEKGPKRLWSEKVGDGHSGIAVAKGRLYTLGNKEGILKASDTAWCLDAVTGKPVWKHSYTSKPGSYPGPRATPTVDGDVLFLLSRHGDVQCLAAADGKVQWQKDVREAYGIKPEPNRWGLACSPLVVGDKLVLDLGKILVMNKTTGELLFEMGEEAPGFSSPIVFDREGDPVVTSLNGFGLALYSLATRKAIGRFEWEAKWRANALTPVVSGDTLFISAGYGKGCALLRLSAEGLEQVYRNDNLSSECHTPVLYEGHLYGVSGSQGRKGALLCIEFATGEAKWKHEGFRVGGGVVIAGGKIIHMEDKGHLVVAEATPEAYRELARATVLDSYCWTPPVLANGLIYCRNSKGTVVCLDVRGE